MLEGYARYNGILVESVLVEIDLNLFLEEICLLVGLFVLICYLIDASFLTFNHLWW